MFELQRAWAWCIATPGRARRHGRARLRPHRRHRLDRRAEGLPLCHAPTARRSMRVVGLVRSLALETAETGVTVNAVCPGFTDTDLVRDSVDAHRRPRPAAPQDERWPRIRASDVPIGRLIKPEEVAAAVLYLCSPDAAAVTGTTLAVAGGEMLMDDTTTHPARCRDQGRRAPGRPQGRAAAVAAAAHLHDADRGRDPPPPARAFRRHAAALRPDGAARPRAERHDARRTVAAHDGVERQRHRPGRPAGRAGPGRAPRRRRTTAARRSSA